jgi:MtN3 and saliva related transmembrane protein
MPCVTESSIRVIAGGRCVNAELIGWGSSLVLLVTIAKQIYKQWHDETSKGVSKWLFIGQLAASAGFTLYSYLVHNWVFVVTNSLMAASAVLGLLVVMRHRTGARTRELHDEQAARR